MSPGARQLRDTERPDAGTAAHDVSVVGYDHTFMARSVHMATVRQSLDEMGRRAVEVLVQRIEAFRRGNAYPRVRCGPSCVVHHGRRRSRCFPCQSWFIARTIIAKVI
jgi:hypothetical protein